MSLKGQRLKIAHILLYIFMVLDQVSFECQITETAHYVNHSSNVMFIIYVPRMLIKTVYPYIKYE